VNKRPLLQFYAAGYQHNSFAHRCLFVGADILLLVSYVYCPPAFRSLAFPDK